MRPSQLVFMMLMIGVIFFAFGAMVDDFETQYVDTGISTASPLNATYRQAFVNTSEINETFYPLVSDIDAVGEGESGGFFLLEALVAIPKVAVTLPGVFFNFIGLVKENLFSIFEVLGINPGVVIFISIALTIMVIFMIVEFLRSYPS